MAAYSGYGGYSGPRHNERSSSSGSTKDQVPNDQNTTSPQATGWTESTVTTIKAVSSRISGLKSLVWSNSDQPKGGSLELMEEAVRDQPRGRGNQANEEEWENVDAKDAFGPLEQALQELEQLRAKQTSNLRKISELEKRANLAESDSRNKQKEITRLTREHSRRPDAHSVELDGSQAHRGIFQTGGSSQYEALLTVVEEKDKQIADLMRTIERLEQELQGKQQQLQGKEQQLEGKEQERNETTQKYITLQNEVRVMKQDSHVQKSKADHFEMCYNQAKADKNQLEVNVAELNKLLDAGPTTYIDGEAPEDVDEKVVISQQQGRIKMLEKEIGQLKQLQEHSKVQCREIHQLKQQCEAFELRKMDLESFEHLLHDSEEQVKVLTKRLMIKEKEAEDMKQTVDLVEAQADDSGNHGKHLYQQHEQLRAKFDRLRTQYNQMEQEHKKVLASLTSMGQISAESSELRNELSKAEANLKKVQSALDSSEAQAIVYKSDFDEERKDREAAHSKFADLEKQMGQQTNDFQEQLKTVSDELDNHKKALEDVEVVKEELEKAVKEARDNSEQWRAEALQGRDELLAKTSQVKAYHKQVDQLKKDLEERSSQLEHSTLNLAHLSEELSTAHKKAQKKDTKADKKKRSSTTDLGPVVPGEGLERKLANAEKRCDDLQTEYEKVKTKYDKSKQNVHQLTLEIGRLKDSNDGLTDKVEHLEDINVKLKGFFKPQGDNPTSQDAVQKAVQKGCQKTSKEEITAGGAGNFDNALRETDPIHRATDPYHTQLTPETPTRPPISADPQVPYRTNDNPSADYTNTAGTPNQQKYGVDNLLGQPSYPSGGSQRPQPGMNVQGDAYSNPQSEYRQPQEGFDQFARNRVGSSGQQVSRDGPSSSYQREHHSEPLNQQHFVPHSNQPSSGPVIQRCPPQEQQRMAQSRGASQYNGQGGQAVSQEVVTLTAPNSLVLGNQQVQYPRANAPSTYPQGARGYQQQYYDEGGNIVVDHQGSEYYYQQQQQQNQQGQYYGGENAHSNYDNRPGYDYNYQQQQQQWVDSQSNQQQQQLVELNTQYETDPTQPPGQQPSSGYPVPRPRTITPKASTNSGTGGSQPSPLISSQPAISNPPSSRLDPSFEPPVRAPEKVAKDTRQFVHDNDLEKDIDQDMEQAAAEVTAGTTEEGTREDAPFDPNLVCPMCMKQYRIGEIQLFRAHVGKCDGTT